MTDDLINDDGFECFYTREEMLEQQCRLLIDDADYAWLEVRRARQHVAKLVQMNTKLSDEISVLKREHHKIRWELSEYLREAGLEAGRQCNAFLGAHGRVRE